jgi:hypothetical protein
VALTVKKLNGLSAKRMKTTSQDTSTSSKKTPMQ